MSEIRAVAGLHTASCRVHVICTDCTSIYFLQHLILMWSYSNIMFASSIINFQKYWYSSLFIMFLSTSWWHDKKFRAWVFLMQLPLHIFTTRKYFVAIFKVRKVVGLMDPYSLCMINSFWVYGKWVIGNLATFYSPTLPRFMLLKFWLL